LIGVSQNLVDLVWGSDRPAPPREKVRVHPEKYAGKSFQEKVSDLRKELENKKAAGFVICVLLRSLSVLVLTTIAAMLDEIAWLLNLRGSE
jgi:Xaa-Pro aminopeptidase